MIWDLRKKDGGFSETGIKWAPYFMSQLCCGNTQLGVARDTSKHFLEGAKDREMRVRLTANGVVAAKASKLISSWGK